MPQAAYVDVFRWRPASWSPDESTDVTLTIDPADGGSRITLDHRGWGRVLGSPAEVGGWFAGGVLAGILRAAAPAAFGDWFTDT